jgi:hypothetical protein
VLQAEETNIKGEVMNTKSPTVNTLYQKLQEKKDVPKVNLPALARRDVPFMECWEADPGKVFISSDFTSLEPSITAHFSRDPNYRYATYDGIGKEPFINEHGVLMIDDIYLMVASRSPGIMEPVIEFFSNPENCAKWVIDSDACKADPLLKGPRKKAKPQCLGFGYGMGPKRFVKQCYDAGIPMTLSQAKLMYKAYWELFPEIRKLTKQLEVAFKKRGFFVNPFGYRLTTEPHKAYNAFIQSSASGVVDIITYKFFRELPEANFECLVHDEYVYQIDEKLLKKAKEVTDTCVESLNKDLAWDIPMRLGFEIGKTFADLK